MDTETRELVYALIISAEAQGPLVTRSGMGGAGLGGESLISTTGFHTPCKFPNLISTTVLVIRFNRMP